MASLRELQLAFAATLKAGYDRAGGAVPPVWPVANLEVYRHNADWQFRNALSLSFPVLRRRVGDDYFRQLATLYRQRFPSRSGDLHCAGREFAGFLDTHLAGSDYAWLADLARLEWARETAAVAQWLPPLTADALARFAPDELERVVFRLQPSLRLGQSAYPVVSVWEANQRENAPPVSQSLGPEQYLIHSGHDRVQITRLSPVLYAWLSGLVAGAPLGEAMSAGGLDAGQLLEALRFTFAESLVCELQSAKR